MFINKSNIGFVIKDYERLIAYCKNDKQRRSFQGMLTSYKAIRDLFDKCK